MSTVLIVLAADSAADGSSRTLTPLELLSALSAVLGDKISALRFEPS